MAAIVLVHGIAQSQLSADQLEQAWLPALAGGLRHAGHPETADQLWRDKRPGGLTARMAFYGNIFLDAGAQGGFSAGDLDPEQQELFDQLALAWLQAAGERASDPGDRREATRLLTELTADPIGAQGVPGLLRPVAQGLCRLRWFAPGGFGFAERFVYSALTEVTRYLTDETIREYAQQQVLSQIDADTRIVVAHSLGSVVAYEALHRISHPVVLLTMGSPLALQRIIYPKLRPQPSTVPHSVTQWSNIADRDDLVAAFLDFTRYFPPAPGSAITPETIATIDNGSQPHSAVRYLNKRTVGTCVAQSLSA